MASYTTHTNGHANGSDDSAVASSSKGYPPVNGYTADAYADSAPPEVDPHVQAAREHGDRLVQHLYESGFQRGNYSDQTVQVGTAVFRLHGIILSRSPYLVHLMSTSPYQGMVFIPLEQYPDLTLEAVTIALGWLYSYDTINMVNAANARATLAAACLFGGMDDLCTHALAVCRDSINVESISDWLAWVDSLNPPATSSSPSAATTPITTSPPPTPLPTSSSSGKASETAAPSILGPYAQLLRDEVFDFLVVTLPVTLQNAAEEDGNPSEAQEALMRIFSTVSFDTFKAAIESPKFAIGSDHDRFRFAKATIARRKEVAGRDVEETVVLAVGEGKSNVHVTRKTKRARRPLWKVTK